MPGAGEAMGREAGPKGAAKPRQSEGFADRPGEVERCARAEYRRLVRIVSITAGSTAAAEDAVQEAFARAWEREAKGLPFVHLAGWVVTVALNQARSTRRRSRTEERFRHRLGRVDGGSPDVAEHLDLQRAVVKLPIRQRQAVVLHYLLDLDVATVARTLGVADGTIKTALFRARAALAVALEDKEVDQR